MMRSAKWAVGLVNGLFLMGTFAYLHRAPKCPTQCTISTCSLLQRPPPACPSQAAIPVNINKDLSQPDAPDDEYIYWSN